MSTASATPSASFTPGPWLLQETVLGICRLIVTVEDVKALKVYPARDDSHAIAYVPTDYNEEGQAANARLIAAAPELYEALTLLLDGKVNVDSRNAVHPYGRFCTVCGVNSEERVHAAKCPVLFAENVLAKSGGKS